MKKILLLMVVALVFTACGPTRDGDTAKDDTKPVATVNCSQGMNEYKVADASIKFCYDKAWGEPVVENAKVKTGAAMTISFGTAGNTKAPMVWVESRDYVPEQGEKKVKFEFLNATASDEAQLKEQFKNAAGYNDAELKVRKSDVGGVRAIRAEVGGDQLLYYFVPDAYYEHHVLIAGPLNMSEVVDNFVFDMAF